MEEESALPVRCINCEVDVGQNSAPFIRCIECSTKDSEVILCALCFLMGAECGAHKRGHNYQVEDPSGPPVFSAKAGAERPWGWKEDMQLIAAAHKFRLGNWDEIAKSMKTERTAEEAKNHFDRYFVRGALGRHASSIISRCPVQENCVFFVQIYGFLLLSSRSSETSRPDRNLEIGTSMEPHYCSVTRPFVDDMTVGECYSPERDPLFGGDNRSSAGKSKWQYVVDFIRENDVSVDLNDTNWFEQLRNELHSYRDEQMGSCHEDGVLNDSMLSDTTNVSVLEAPSAPTALTPPLSPVRVIINSADVSSDESSELGAALAPIRTRRFSHARMVSNVGLQSSGDETDHSSRQESPRRASLPGTSCAKRMKYMSKKGRRLKRIASKNKERDGTFAKPKVTVKISERDQEHLLATYTEPYLRSAHSTGASQLEKLSKIKEDDLQLLAYMPKRDDFEHEYNNECERLISRLQLNPLTSGDEDEEFALGVKINKVLYYNRQLMQRLQRKNMLREFDLISEFFDKIKNNAAHPRKALSPQSRISDRCQERYDEKRYLLSKVRQVVNKEEFKQLSDVIARLESTTRRIEELKDMKARGIKVLKPGQKIEHDQHSRRRKRRGDKYRNSQRKVTLRWNRFKRWNKRQQLKNEATESDA
ncbi:Transcriptional adapter 2B [Toxocara canis]|uniref:Transcriptional adapter 2B n=1 Tax=Toxocara canis TaxID=6265 RepID=A0A0B2UPQ8_TOXCA|nr:Transcriptional adapter 2B [Toxocara canis]